MQLPKQTDFEERFDQAAGVVFAWACLRIPEELRFQLEPRDVVHEVWLRGVRAYDGFDERRAKFRSWLIGIAKNVLLEGLRGLRRSGGGAIGPSTRLYVLSNYPESVTTLSQRVERDETLRAFFEYAGTLDEESRRMMAFIGMEGMSVKDAAVRLDLSHEVALKRWQRLRARISGSAFAERLFQG